MLQDDAPPVPPPPATEEDEPAQVRKQSIEHADRADPADFQVTEVCEVHDACQTDCIRDCLYP